MGKFKSYKRLDGYSSCFRQWKAASTHCRFLHSYNVYFDVEFEGDLDFRNWVADFGMFSRSTFKIESKTPKEYFNWLLDHTTLVAEDDPYLEEFKLMDKNGLIQLRTLPNVGCERLAQHLFDKISHFTKVETNGRVKLNKVIVYENDKNSASYEE